MVGPNKQSWMLHEYLLCDRVDFFRKAFQGGFKEATTKEIHLEEDDPGAFGLFVEWLYGSSILMIEHRVNDSCIEAYQDLNQTRSTSNKLTRWRHLEVWCRLYIFAGKLGLKDIQREIVNIYDGNKDEWDLEVVEVQFVFENTVDSEEEYSRYIRNNLVEIQVTRFLTKGFDSFEDWAKVNACNLDFGKAVAGALNAHYLLPKWHCGVSKCTVHSTHMG